VLIRVLVCFMCVLNKINGFFSYLPPPSISIYKDSKVGIFSTRTEISVHRPTPIISAFVF
jgi:hypothetical protein